MKATINGQETHVHVYMKREADPFDTRILFMDKAGKLTINLTYKALRSLIKDLQRMRSLMILDLDEYNERNKQSDSQNRALDAEPQPETNHDVTTASHRKNPGVYPADNVDTQASGIDLASALEESNRFAPIVEWTATSHLTTSPERGNE